MIALLATSFLASLAGSLHCAGMCGPLMILLRGGNRTTTQAAYQTGRVGSYALLGLGAGAVGHGVETWATALGLEQGALLLGAGALLSMLLLPRLRPATHASTTRLHVMRTALASASPGLRGFLFGSATGLMPCGWLYAWLALAAASGTALSGAALMVAFGLGSVPALVGSDFVLGKVGAVLQRRSRFAPVALVGAAALALFMRSTVLGDLRQALHEHSQASAPLVCHGG